MLLGTGPGNETPKSFGGPFFLANPVLRQCHEKLQSFTWLWLCLKSTNDFLKKQLAAFVLKSVFVSGLPYYWHVKPSQAFPPSLVGAMLRRLLSICSASLLVPLAFGLPSVPSTPFWFQQKVSHFSASNATYWQRYYINEEHWAGPGNPIFVIMGGEGGISPETGIFYPWVTDILAKEYRGLVIQPEHRFYGESLPFGNASYLPINMRAATRFENILEFCLRIEFWPVWKQCTCRIKCRKPLWLCKSSLIQLLHWFPEKPKRCTVLYIYTHTHTYIH